ncbi:MAG TPA: hypothetical protein VJ880_01325 [Allomuricauda sp.]|nr:hypothetical protein [Allomuricauda sp.]
MNTKKYKKLRWVIRGLSGLLVGFSLLMFIGETFFEESTSESLTSNAILQLSVAAVGLIGLGAAWKWELIGGIIALAFFILLAIINPKVLEMPLMYVWPVNALLFILLWVLNKNSPT